MSLLIALVVAIALLALIIYVIVNLMIPTDEPSIGDGIWRVTEVDDGRFVTVHISRGSTHESIGTADKDALDFESRLRELVGNATVKAEKRNEAQVDVKTLFQEVK